jgi:hypothetical protein
MPTGVSHAFGGNVVIVDMENGTRFDMTPAMALTAAAQCEELAGRGGDAGMAILKALDDRYFRFCGGKADLLTFATDLRHHASEAAATALAQ